MDHDLTFDISPFNSELPTNLIKDHDFDVSFGGPVTFIAGGGTVYFSAKPDNRELYNSGKYSDLTIECNGRTWPVHKAVVCIKCNFLEQCMLVNLTESQAGYISLPDEDPDTVARMIQFLYLGDYVDSNPPVPQKGTPKETTQATTKRTRRNSDASDSPPAKRQKFIPMKKEVTYQKDLVVKKRAVKKTPVKKRPPVRGAARNPLAPVGGTKAFVDHVRVFILADKFLLPDLATLAIQKYKNLAKAKNWEADGFVESINLAWTEVPDTSATIRHLRSIILGLMYLHRKSLLENPDFQDIISDNPVIGLDLVKISSRDPFGRRDNALQVIWRCSGCGRLKACEKCGLEEGGFLLPPKEYELGMIGNGLTGRFDSQDWVCVDEECGAVNEVGCGVSRRCGDEAEGKAGGRFVAVETLPPKEFIG